MANEKIALEVSVNGEQAVTSVGQMKKAIKDARSELLQAQAQFGEFSNEAVQAASKVAQLNDKVQAAGDLVNRLNPDQKFKAFSNTIQGLVGGFAGLQGAIGLLGTQSEEVEKQLLKVQSALALSQGIDSVVEAGESFKALIAIVRNGVITAFTALRAAIGATGIGLLVIGVGTLVANFDKVKKAITETFPALGNMKELFNQFLQVIRGVGSAIGQFIIAPFKAIGKAFEGDFAGALEDLKKGVDLTGNYLSGVQDEVTRQAKNAEEERLENSIKANEKQLEVARARGRNTVALEKEILNQKLTLYKDDEEKYAETQQAIKVLDAKVAKEREDISKAAAEKERQRKNAENERIKKEEEQRAFEQAQAFQNAYKNALAADVKVREELALVGKTQREKDLIEIERWFEAQKAIYEAGGVDIVNLVKLRDEKVAQVAVEQRAREATDLANYISGVKGQFEQFGKEQYDLMVQQNAAEKQLDDLKVQGKRDMVNSVIGILGNLSSLIGQQTAVGKALSVAQASIETYSSASTMFAQATKNPITTVFPAYPYVQAAAVIVGGLARVKQILSVKIPKVADSGSVSLPSNASAPLAPTAQTVQPTSLDADTINNLGNKAIKAYVLENEISDSIVKQRRIEKAARLG